MRTRTPEIRFGLFWLLFVPWFSLSLWFLKFQIRTIGKHVETPRFSIGKPNPCNDHIYHFHASDPSIWGGRARVYLVAVRREVTFCTWGLDCLICFHICSPLHLGPPAAQPFQGYLHAQRGCLCLFYLRALTAFVSLLTDLCLSQGAGKWVLAEFLGICKLSSPNKPVSNIVY